MPRLEVTYKGPWQGVDISVPETDINSSATPFCENFVLRRGEIRTRPNLGVLCLAPQDITPVLGMTSFVDLNGVAHTVAITQNAIYQLSFAFSSPNYRGNPWLPIFSFPVQQPSNPYAIANLNGKIYFSNGGQFVWSWDGISNTLTNVGNLAGGQTIGALYLMELGARIVLASTIETSGTPSVSNGFPFRVRWSPVNLGVQTFDPNTNIGAGFNDMFDVPDTVTGILPIGRTGYVFRTNGITEMVPTTGQGLVWTFNHLWASDRGIGNAFPQTLAGFGPMGIFGSGEAFYKITPNSFDDISSKATDDILTDLANRNGSAFATILPYLAPGYAYSVYMLFIQMGQNTVSWWYDIKENSWSRHFFTNKIFTCKPKFVYIE